MHSITLKTEIITPLFIAGADQRNIENEGLRAPSLRGLLRWWFRTLRASDDLQQLLKEEKDIFGSPELRSSIAIRVKSNRINRIGTLQYKKRGYIFKYSDGTEDRLSATFDGRERRVKGDDSGICYLFSILQHRPFLDVGCSFEINILSTKDEYLKKALASLWSAIYLGNFGARARRGAGDLAVLQEGTTLDKIKTLTNLNFIPDKENAEELLGWIMDNLDKVVKIINNGEKPKNFSSRYSNLCFSRMIMSEKSFKSWKDALNDIGKMYEEFRFKHRKEYLDVVAFGIPIVHGKKFTVQGRKGNEEIKRRSSPLIFKVFKSKNKYYWGLIRLSGEFLPEGGVITTRKRTQKPDYRLIDEFWNEARNQGYEKILLTPLVLDNAIEKIKKEVNPEKIILFGSRARGDAHKWADIDLAVDSEKSVIETQIPADIIWLKTASEDIKEKIKKEGTVVYERKS